MAGLPLQSLVRTLRRAVEPATIESTDSELLSRFSLQRDEAAFEVLVWRHGGMVLNLCRRIARHEQDAEDAFQATFMALALEGGRVARRDQIGGWLHRVAVRVAMKIRTKSARLCHPSYEIEQIAESTSGGEFDLREILDEEILRLPRRFRLPFVLCCLEGRSNSEAARELGCPKGTIDSRLSAARQKLRNQLIRRGVTTMATGAAIESMLAGEASAALPALLVRNTVQGSMKLAAGGTTNAEPLIQLARGVVDTMFHEKLRRSLIVLAVAVLIAGGAGWASVLALAQNPQKPGANQPQQPQPLGPPSLAGRLQQPDDAKSTKKPDPAKSARPTNQELRRILRQPRTLDTHLDKIPLCDALEFLAESWAVSLRFDYPAFARLNYRELYALMEMKVSLRKGNELTLQQVLDEVLAQVPLDNTAGMRLGVLVKAGQIMIVPQFAVADMLSVDPQEAGIDVNSAAGVFSEPVNVQADERPLNEVLNELAEATGANILVDARVKDKAKTTVTMHLQESPLITTIQLLADMADVKVVELDNILYVTSAENATRILKEHVEAEKRRKRIPKFGAGGGA